VLKHSVLEEIPRFNKEFKAAGIEHLTQRWKICVDNEDDFVEK
jgi:hypothetical protein